MKLLISTAMLGLATALCLAAPASADPKGNPFPVVCENGVTYMVTVNGNGNWTPAHDSNSTSILVPTSFSGLHGELTDSTGTVLDTFDDPPAAKGMSGKQARATTTSCTFEIIEHFTDPELGELTSTVTGGVTGFITPVH
jgi:hypothetical protein